MKAVAITSLALVASVQAAGWKDADPAKSTTTTAASSTWADVSISKTTTTTKPVSEETQSYCMPLAPGTEPQMLTNARGR